MTNHSTATRHESLHLAHDTNTSLPLERRRYSRQTVEQRVTAAVTSLGDDSDTDLRICSLLLTDLSPAGAGAMVQEPLPIGAQITVFCPPHGAEPGFDLQGTIVRCQRQSDGKAYSLGIQVLARMAA
ncbi:PilZ domain-containing protein [Phycisphaerales bacterium AB-hyl4]|uniref:PilZ domain-containing protein n=1 Tax=Natronomicrosphaera hydrolytica TaxID=3242702 RepID=A0ABV4U0R8_9BACT